MSEERSFTRAHPYFLLFLFFAFSAHCRSDCVRRCGLDPIEVDLNRFKTQKAGISEETKMLKARVDEFEDKVFVNQRAALDLLRVDLVSRSAEYVRKFARMEIKTDVVKEIYEKELNGYKKLAEAYRILQNAFETNDSSLIRKGLSLREKGLHLVRGAEIDLNKLERKYWRGR